MHNNTGTRPSADIRKLEMCFHILLSVEKFHIKSGVSYVYRLKTVVKTVKQALLIFVKALRHDHTSNLINYIHLKLL